MTGKATGKTIEHTWAYCDHCERWMVRCGKCGNNTCNGMYGLLAADAECDLCPEAYALDDSNIGNPGKETS